ncbi:cobalt-precorrin-8X methylmutase [Candidatus Atelocyanobacterium thalassae]|uniref:Cobalt-precorrin-8 methylmutase n=1 Tax=cyanobacterium endosymbiont of Braarudosphaera bigelowii TaxID=1285375 RepID=A0ABM7U654_9CHRO|nr:cobalt-precorrin-8X methylmutase [Candidatus Atelocyanobacterium thalassa]BDA40175.1 cobalt-precorrin-8 methylmutase [cyanobacterium endosymbiont of Braarudosphaera bigelowii]
MKKDLLWSHPITNKSFAIIDQEIGQHKFEPLEYKVARRVIHSTADFDLINSLVFSPGAIINGINAIKKQTTIVTDVTMVRQGVFGLVGKTFKNLVVTSVNQASSPNPGKTLTETGLLKCCSQYPTGIYVIGNAPTALLTLCQQIILNKIQPSLIIAAPVGFVSVLEAKQALKRVNIPKIFIKGRKGGSPIAASILNALVVLAYENEIV